ncbi:MAG: O-antigen ligase family protein, partial [Polyangiaceae bacterium]
LKGVAYLLAFVTALAVARRRDGGMLLSATIAVTGLLLAVAAVLHPAFGAHRLFGVYAPGPGVAGRHLAPLMDPNNLAGYLNIALCLSLAIAIAPEPRVPRSISGAVVLLLAATQAWVASRGGMVTMVLGALIVVAMTRVSRAREPRAVVVLSVLTGVAMMLGAVLIVIGGSDVVWSELGDTDVSKLRFFASTIRVLPAMPFFGSGRGSFESVFPAFRTDSGFITYTHPENVVAQWLVEWGAPVGIAGLAAIVVALRPTVALARSSSAAGAWAAVLAIGVQNLGDLGTEIPGLMLPCVVCGALVVAGSPGAESTSRFARWAQRPRRVAVGGVMAATAGLALVVLGLGKELHDDQDGTRVAALDSNLSRSQMHVVARAAMLRHPAEPYIPFVTAVRAVREGDDDPIPWLGGTFERASVYAPAHLLLARILAARSPSQARMEYRLALEQAPNLVDAVMPEAARVVGGYFDATELVPDGEDGVPVMEYLVRAIEDRLPATRVRIDAEILSRAPEAYGATLRCAVDSLDDLEAADAAPWCQVAPDVCVRDALTKAGRVEQIAPDRCAGYGLHARVRLASGDAAGAVADLAHAVDHVVDRVSCLQQLVAVARGAGDEPRVEAALQEIVTAGCVDAKACVENLVWVAGQYESTGRPHQALAMYKRAFDRIADDVLLEHMAALAAGVGLHAEAAADYDQLAHRHPEEARWQRLRGEQRDAAMTEVEKL